MAGIANPAAGGAPDSTQHASFDLAELTKMYDFTGLAVAVTGGAGVLGSEIARALAGCGAQVAILDLNIQPAKALIDSLGEHGKQISLHQCDVPQPRQHRPGSSGREKPHSAKSTVSSTAREATSRPPPPALNSRFFDLPADALRWVFDLNILGTMLPSQAFGKIMAEQGYGTILNISSMNAFRPLTRIPAYSGAKAAVSNFTQWLAVHMAQEYSPKIRVNAVAPGFFLTNQNRFLLTDKETGALTKRGNQIIAHTPMARFGEPKDLFGAVLWLLSPASEFVTGVVIPIDGGFSAYSGV